MLIEVTRGWEEYLNQRFRGVLHKVSDLLARDTQNTKIMKVLPGVTRAFHSVWRSSRCLHNVNHPLELAANVTETQENNAEPELEQFINEIITNHVRQGIEDQFHVYDFRQVKEKCHQFKTLLPDVKPFYAMKCCHEPRILQLLNKNGVGFDCASGGEVKRLKELQVDSDNIIFANTVKRTSHLRYASEHNVNLMTFDSASEIVKIKENHPNAELLLRLSVDDSLSRVKLSSKFGAELWEIPELISQCKHLNVDLTGITFHVGSGIGSPLQFHDCIKLAHEAFKIASSMGMQLSILDIGGGFPGNDNGKLTFPECASVIRKGLDLYFPSSRGVQVIAEPGTFYIKSAVTEVCQVIGKSLRKVVSPDSGEMEQVFMYFLNSGVYSTFSDPFQQERLDIAIIKPKNAANPDLHPSVIWGQTCDSADVINRSILLPELEIGDYVGYRNIGDYSIVLATNFCGFSKPLSYFFDPEN